MPLTTCLCKDQFFEEHKGKGTDRCRSRWRDHSIVEEYRVTSGEGNTCKETPLAFLTNHHPILQGWKWREKLQVCRHGWKLAPKDLTFSPEISCYSWQPPWWPKGFLFPFMKPPSKGVIDFLFSVPKCIWATRGGHLPRRKVFLYAPLGTQSWLIHLRLSHLGHSLVDNTRYLLSVTAYNVNLGKGND